MSTSKTDQKAAPWGEGESIGREYPSIPLLEKIAYGVGVLPMNTSVNSIKKLSGPIFNITLGMHPFRVGNVLLAARIWDAITDPVMGWISDNTKSRWGRRRPYLFLGAILTAIGYALILNVPKGLSQDALYAYFFLASLGLYTCVTILQVSYNSLGFELSHNYHERTNIFAYRSFFQQISNILVSALSSIFVRSIFLATL